MKLTLDRSALLKALTAVQGAVSRKSVNILQHVLIDAHADGRVTFAATNTDLEATVTTKGRTCAPADMLAKIAQAAAEGSEISMELGARLAVKSGRSRFNLSVLPAEDFPTFSAFKADVEINTDAPMIARLIGRVQHAQSSDAGKFIMNSVYLTAAGGVLTSIATDTAKLAMVEEAWEGAGDFGVVIPTPMVTEMMRALNGAELATLRVSASKVQIQTVNVTVTSKVIVGPYVNFRSVIPSATPNQVRVSGAALIAAVRRAAIVADDKSRACNIRIEAGVIKVSARGQDADAGDEVDCEYAGPALSPSVNSMNMAEALEAVEGDAVLLSFTDRADTPFVLRGEGDNGLMQLVMPLRG